jgi:hypothetical protein
MNKWSNLNHLQLNREGRKFAENAFTKAGFDVYISNKKLVAIDLIARKNKDTYYEVQVSSIRENKYKQNYVFYRKKDFKPRKNLLVILLIFGDKELPDIFLIPSLSWIKSTSSLLMQGGSETGKSKPEWAISINRSTIGFLKEKFAFNKQVKKI